MITRYLYWSFFHEQKKELFDSLQYVPSVPPRVLYFGVEKASSIEKLSLYTSEFGIRGNNFSEFNDTERLTSRHILFPLLGSNHKRHGTGRILSESETKRFTSSNERPSDDPSKELAARIRIFWPRTRNPWTGKNSQETSRLHTPLSKARRT